jgi:hypothetical protein
MSSLIRSSWCGIWCLTRANVFARRMPESPNCTGAGRLAVSASLAADLPAAQLNRSALSTSIEGVFERSQISSEFIGRKRLTRTNCGRLSRRSPTTFDLATLGNGRLVSSGLPGRDSDGFPPTFAEASMSNYPNEVSYRAGELIGKSYEVVRVLSCCEKRGSRVRRLKMALVLPTLRKSTRDAPRTSS